jgi:hypothetical protein
VLVFSNYSKRNVRTLDISDFVVQKSDQISLWESDRQPESELKRELSTYLPAQLVQPTQPVQPAQPVQPTQPVQPAQLA